MIEQALIGVWMFLVTFLVAFIIGYICIILINATYSIIRDAKRKKRHGQ